MSLIHLHQARGLIAPGSTPAVVGTPVNTQGSGANTYDVDLVGSPTVGNYQILIASSSNDETFDTPSGWTAVRAVQHGNASVLALQAFYREITAGNVGETTVTLTAGAVTFTHNCLAMEIENFGALDASAAETYSAGSTTSHTGLSVTTTTDGCLVIEVMNMRTDAGGTAPGTGSTYQDSNNLLFYATQDAASAGATTGLSYTSVDAENGFPKLTFAIS